jgi:hypothetical protein
MKMGTSEHEIRDLALPPISGIPVTQEARTAADEPACRTAFDDGAEPRARAGWRR